MDILDYGFFVLLSILLAIVSSKIGEKLRKRSRSKFDFEKELRKRIVEWLKKEESEETGESIVESE